MIVGCNIVIYVDAYVHVTCAWGITMTCIYILCGVHDGLRVACSDWGHAIEIM